jgi:hypothetical protein
MTSLLGETHEEAIFFPWMDSALLPEESAYSVINKVAWFLAISPIQFLRACKSGAEGRTYGSPIVFDFSDNNNWSKVILAKRMAPLVNGVHLRDYLEMAAGRKTFIPADIRSLHICRKCIDMGVHLQIHQHSAIDACPIHANALESVCRFCKSRLALHLSTKFPAFSCSNCGHSLMLGSSIVLHHTVEFRRSVTESAAQFVQWKEKALLEQSVDCGLRYPYKMQSSEPLLIDKDIKIVAGTINSVPPTWVRKLSGQGADIGYRRIDLSGPLGNAISSQIVEEDVDALAKEPNFDGPPSMQYHQYSTILTLRISEDRFRVALRRVTSIFLARYHHSHRHCLDAPQAMFGQGLLGHDHPEDILECCPVAIGFWLWRIASANFYDQLTSYVTHYYTQGRHANIDLLLYAIARSHLHYCVYVAKYCVDLARAHPSVLAGELISPISEAMHCGWSAVLFKNISRNLRYFERDGKSYYIRFNLTDILPTITCRGSDIYGIRLQRELDSAERKASFVSSGVADASNMSVPFELPESDPFLPMKQDYLFLSYGDDREISNAYWESFRVRGNRQSKYNKIGGYAVVDSAIDSKIDPAGMILETAKRRRP